MLTEVVAKFNKGIAGRYHRLGRANNPQAFLVFAMLTLHMHEAV
jgi:hypothetical protein